MPINLGTPIITAAAAAESSTPAPIPEEEEFYSSWSLFLVCLLLILSLWTSYYLQIKRIRAIHETVVSIIAGMVVGFTVRIAPGHLIREMLVSYAFGDLHDRLFENGPCLLYWRAGVDSGHTEEERRNPSTSRSYVCGLFQFSDPS
jgi:hypothetical protein